MPNAVIVDAVRTPVGRRGGRLSGWHATDLAAQPLAALLARNDLDPSLVEDVVMGCTMTVGEQAMNIARNAALAAGFPDSVPGTTASAARPNKPSTSRPRPSCPGPWTWPSGPASSP